MYANVAVFNKWTDVPQTIRSHCMEKIGPGLYGHHRLSTVFLISSEIDHKAAVKVVMDEVLTSFGRRNR